MSVLGEKIRDRRLELGLTQEQAARRSNGLLSRAVWQRIEGGDDKFSVRSAQGIAAALGWQGDAVQRIGKGLEPIEADPIVAGSRSVIEAVVHDPALDGLSRDVLLAVYEALVRSTSSRR